MFTMKQPTHNTIELVPSARNLDTYCELSMLGRRSAVDVQEDADAHLTGMTRSLDRRLLALNLQPMSPLAVVPYRKVA